jgi:hypothetical protein
MSALQYSEAGCTYATNTLLLAVAPDTTAPTQLLLGRAVLLFLYGRKLPKGCFRIEKYSNLDPAGSQEQTGPEKDSLYPILPLEFKRGWSILKQTINGGLLPSQNDFYYP